MSPFYEKLTFKLEFITPAFIGGAFPDQEAELRPASFIGILRWWFRNLALTVTDDIEAIAYLESELFGNQKRAGKVWVRFKETYKKKREDFFKLFPLDDKQKLLLSYSGFGNFIGKKNVKAFIFEQTNAQMSVLVPKKYCSLIKSFLYLVSQLGSMGGRNRRGWGSFILKPQNVRCSENPKELENFFQTWEFFDDNINQKLRVFQNYLKHKYPFLINKGANPYLEINVSKTKFVSKYWYKVLIQFAEKYKKYRKNLDSEILKNFIKDFCKSGKEKIDFCEGENNNVEQELDYKRFYLGLPIVNICYNSLIKDGIKNKARIFIKSKKNQRRASPLLFKVSKLHNNQYIGIVASIKGKFLPKDLEVCLEVKCEEDDNVKELIKKNNGNLKNPCNKKINGKPINQCSKHKRIYKGKLIVNDNTMKKILDEFIAEIKED